MHDPNITYAVTRPDESIDRGLGRAFIHSLGHAATQFDVYRTVAVHSVDNPPASWCLTDTDAAAALGRIIDGPIRSYLDIKRAESALRALLLHEFVQVLVPCAKAEQTNGLVYYVRFDTKERNEAAFTAFNVAPCQDLLFATEYLRISDGKVTESSNINSHIVGESTERLESNYRTFIESAGEVASAYAFAVNAATYFTGPELVAPLRRGPAGFIDELYSRIYRPWMDFAQAGPALHIDIKLPPLLAIVLSRAPFRERIPDVLRELREELSTVRADLNGMNAMLDRTLSQADIHAQVRKINESFDAIVSEALLTDAERKLRRLVSVFEFVRPVHQLYSIAVDPLSADRDKFFEIFNSTREAVLRSSRIVSRSVSAAKLAELLRVESAREIVLTHFSGTYLTRS